MVHGIGLLEYGIDIWLRKNGKLHWTKHEVGIDVHCFAAYAIANTEFESIVAIVWLNMDFNL